MCAKSEIHGAECRKVYCLVVDHQLTWRSPKKKNGHCPDVLMRLRLQSPSKPMLFVCVQNFTSFLVLETARSVVFTAQWGQNSCAAAHARSLEGTLLTSLSDITMTVYVT